jgi:5,10-methylenetetrahydrofolate reductase
MKIEELISGKNDQGEVNFEGISIPVSALKDLVKDGYEHVKFYKDNNTFSLWGKTCTACFTEVQLRERTGSK